MEKVETVEKYFPGTKTLWERYKTKDGKKHGTREVFYESGEIESRIEYVEGERHGTHEEFCESGGVRDRMEFVEGKMHGTSEEFYESGGIRLRAEYVEGKKNGTSEWFHESGEIDFRDEYVEGKTCVPHKEYNLRGDLVLDIVLEDGMQIDIKDSLNVVNLDKIIDFLDKLPTEKFDFSIMRSACVVELFPSIFTEVEYTNYLFRLNGMDNLTYFEVASLILNVSKAIAFDLFTPRDEISELFPTLPVCGREATPKEVSAKLKAFKELVMVA